MNNTPDGHAQFSPQGDVPFSSISLHHQGHMPQAQGNASAGHISYPVLAREQSTLESIRTITSGLKSLPLSLSSASKHAPAPSPPSQSRSIATTYGSFVGPAHVPMTPPQVLHSVQHGWPPLATQLEFSHPDLQPPVLPPVSAHPSSIDDKILWSSWDDIISEDGGKRKLLILGYQARLQIWDVTVLNSLKEILNIPTSSVIGNPTLGCWTVTRAVVLPPPSNPADDCFANLRPLLAIVSRDLHQASHPVSEVLIYSLRTHIIVKRLSGVTAGRAPSEMVPITPTEMDEEIDFSTVVNISPNSQFIAISTSRPLAIHILSASSLSVLYSIPSQSLTPFTPTFSSTTHPESLGASQWTRPTFALAHRLIAFASPPPLPHHRTRTPTNPGFLSSTSTGSVAPTLSTLGETVSGGASVLGSGAKKVGEGMWIGMRALSNLAFGNPTTTGSSSTTAGGPHTPNIQPGASYPPTGTPYFSKSIPTNGPPIHPYSPRYRNGNSSVGLASPSPSSVSPHSPGGFLSSASRRSSSGLSVGESALNPPVESAYVTVLDLSPLLSHAHNRDLAQLPISAPSSPPQPLHVAHFLATSVSTPVNMLSFSPSGILLAVSDVTGKTVKVFQIRGGGQRNNAKVQGSSSGIPASEAPSPRVSSVGLRRQSNGGASDSARLGSNSLGFVGGTGQTPAMQPAATLTPSSVGSRRRSSGGSSASGSTTAPSSGDSVWHLYDLQRGSTHASVEGISWSSDARWVGVSTAKGTFHVFAINPYGGKPDENSHLDGKVRNSSTMHTLSVPVQAVARLRSPLHQEALAPPSFSLVPLSQSRRSTSLPPPVPSQAQLSPAHAIRQQLIGGNIHSPKTGFQDVLVLDPTTGVLSLRRCLISMVMNTSGTLDAKSGSTRTPSGAPEVSKSLPASGVSMMMNFMTTVQNVGLRAAEVPIASWDLRGDKDWGVVKATIQPSAVATTKHGFARTKSDWLSRAELSTSSKSLDVLPRPVYLSHQFTFYQLPEEWRTLVRSSRLEIPCTKIEVRKEVEIMTSPSGSGRPTNASADDLLSTSHPRSIASSFDEPLASAMQSNLNPTNLAPTVIPSYPNAYKGTSSSWRDTYNLPIRSVAAGLSDGVNEGLGRLKREIKARTRTRSPHRASNADTVLVFDENAEQVFVETEEDSPPALEKIEEAAFIDPTDAATPDPPVAVSQGDPHSETSESVASPNLNPGPIPAEPGNEPDVTGNWDHGAVGDLEEYRLAVAEDATFDDIGVAGFLMEEEERKAKERAAALLAQASEPVKHAPKPKVAKGKLKKRK